MTDFLNMQTDDMRGLTIKKLIEKAIVYEGMLMVELNKYQ
jgi:hypothetical protein